MPNTPQNSRKASSRLVRIPPLMTTRRCHTGLSQNRRPRSCGVISSLSACRAWSATLVNHVLCRWVASTGYMPMILV